MEDLKAYIESGLLELYAMGDLNLSEREEVEFMLGKHPELRYELNEIEKALALYAEKNAVQPDENLREKVLASLNFADEKADHPVPVQQLNTARQNNLYKYAFAASLALLALSTITIINLNSRLKESNNRIASLELSNQKFTGRVNYMQQELTDANQVLEVLQHPKEYKLVELKGLPKAPQARMVVAFNPAKAVVMIDLASLEMPAADQAHQYQLWALVDGKPVDLGVFDAKPDSTGMIKMKPLANAQAFAVTLEPKGGSASPTMEQMMAMGSI